MTKFIHISLSCFFMIALSEVSFADQLITSSLGDQCTIASPIDLEGADYKKKDQKREEKLCSYDFHASEDTDSLKAVALCPKLFSTFPAVEVFKIPQGMTKQEFEQNRCSEEAGQKTDGKKLAKYKYSTSCSKTASIIGYYHISRALGIKSVPTAVLKTMDREAHLSIAREGREKLRGSGELIESTFRTLVSRLSNRSELIVLPSGTHSYGGLSVNPTGEHFYRDFYPRSGGNNGVKRFKRLDVYKDLGKSDPVSSFVGHTINTENFTRIQQMKDASDMIVLDTLFGQKDRMGNIAAYDIFMSQVDGKVKTYDIDELENLIEETESIDWQTRWIEANAISDEGDKREAIIDLAKGYFQSQSLSFAHSQEILLKDNDCGLRNENLFRRNDMIEGVKHFNKETYVQVQRLQEKVSTGDLDNFLTNNLAMTSGEMAEFKANLEFMAGYLKGRCESGRIHTDLNVKNHFSTPVQNMDLCAQN